jgi:hypothetical protein
MGDGVIVEHRHPTSCGKLDAAVARGRKASIFAERVQYDVWKIFVHHTLRPIAGRIVDDDDLLGRPGLMLE